jgi:carboxypeptidase C (cathepsin A)
VIYRAVVPALIVLVLALGLAPAQETKPLKDHLSVTEHSLKLGETQLDYTVTAGTLVLKEEDGKPLASVFFVAYTKNGADLTKRPVTFAFNGGPGSSSVWLHMGAFAPKKVQLDDDGNPPPPPYRLVDNPSTLLDITDLVFIDPVTTGYSRPAPGVPNSKFHGVQQDVESVGEFIRLYTTRYKRWPSPKFLAGESYGGTRAAGLVAWLQDRQNMNFNGVILVSPALNFQTIVFNEGNDLPYVLFLPTYAATAWYHKRLSRELQAEELKKTVAEAENFAKTEYTVALMKGDRLPEVDKKALAAKIARLTGLSEKYVLHTNLRINIQRFCRELLRDQRETVGRFDSRFVGAAKDAAGEVPDYDASAIAHDGAYTATLNQYLRHDLKFETDLPYEILTRRVQPWDYGTAKNRYLNVTPSMRDAMTKNRDLKVFVADGYYDLATPFCATDYSIDHLGLEPARIGNVTTCYYEAGHMMYVHKKSHEQLRQDLVKFYQGAVR